MKWPDSDIFTSDYSGSGVVLCLVPHQIVENILHFFLLISQEVRGFKKLSYLIPRKKSDFIQIKVRGKENIFKIFQQMYFLYLID